MSLAQADLTPFRNQGECVAYGAHGGTVTGSQLRCESFGGTFALGPAPALWTCTHFAITGITEINQLAETCVLVDGGTGLVVTPYAPFADATCFD